MVARRRPAGGTKQKKQVLDRVSGRLVTAGPEEVNATQPLVELLVDEAGWDDAQFVTRPQMASACESFG